MKTLLECIATPLNTIGMGEISPTTDPICYKPKKKRKSLKEKIKEHIKNEIIT